MESTEIMKKDTQNSVTKNRCQLSAHLFLKQWNQKATKAEVKSRKYRATVFFS